MREGWITEAELNACLREEKAGSARRSLSEILVARGILDAARVKDLQARLTRRRMSCPACSVSFSVLSLAQSKVVVCPRCSRPLVEAVQPTLQRRDDSLDTGTLLKALSATPKPPKKSPPPSAPGPR